MTAYARRGVHGQTVDTLARRILGGRIPEGATLDVAGLQQELAVSLTALREALKVLAAKGIVDARQKRGTFVRPRADWHLLDADVIGWQVAEGSAGRLLDELHEVRDIVEPAAARLAARRATVEDLVELDGALEAMARAGADVGAAVDADLRFHRALLAAARNEVLRRMEIVLVTRLAERDRMVHRAAPRDPLPSHRAVAGAIRSGDADAAEAAMRLLLEQSRRDAAFTHDPAR